MIEGWDAFVQSHPKGTIFHSSAMQRCESNTELHQPLAIGAINQHGELCAILTSVRVSTIGGMASRYCTRSIFYAEPIFLDNEEGRRGVHQLIRYHDDFVKSNTLFAEVRPVYAPLLAQDNQFLMNGYTLHGYVNFELAINADEQSLFEKIGPKRRNNVRSSLRRGVTVQECQSAVGTAVLYRLLAESHAHSKTPLADKSLFEAALANLPTDAYKILVAFYQGKPVAAGCFLAYKNRVICWYAGTLRIPGIAATSLVFWEAIKRYAEMGYEIFDFAGGGWEGESYGPGKFKSKFGGEVIHTGRYRKIFSPRKFRIAEAFFNTFRGWVSPERKAKPFLNWTL